jgi:hypothetical protein
MPAALTASTMTWQGSHASPFLTLVMLLFHQQACKPRVRITCAPLTSTCCAAAGHASAEVFLATGGNHGETLLFRCCARLNTTRPPLLCIMMLTLLLALTATDPVLLWKI